MNYKVVKGTFNRQDRGSHNEKPPREVFKVKQGEVFDPKKLDVSQEEVDRQVARGNIAATREAVTTDGRSHSR